MSEPWQTREVTQTFDELAPDGSEIRWLCKLPLGSTVHCRFAPGKISKAVVHKTVSEIWFVLGGSGEIWRKSGPHQAVTKLEAGLSLTIPVGTHFQFRVLGKAPLDLHIVTLPPWPGDHESTYCEGNWEATV